MHNRVQKELEKKKTKAPFTFVNVAVSDYILTITSHSWVAALIWFKGLITFKKPWQYAGKEVGGRGGLPNSSRTSCIVFCNGSSKGQIRSKSLPLSGISTVFQEFLLFPMKENFCKNWHSPAVDLATCT